MKNAVVIIPIYQEVLTNFENISLMQCFKILKDHEIVFIKPERLKENSIQLPVSPKAVVFFNNEYFSDVYGYNRLMLSNHFYEKFIQYEYMLIYQLDAFVFKDELTEWAGKKFDYIGASWLPPEDSKESEVWYRIRAFFYIRYNIKKRNGGPSVKKEMYYRVGNGGFSLRRISTFLKVLNDFSDKAEIYREANDGAYHEDIFWSIEVNRKEKNIKLPSYKEGLRFSIETEPCKALKLINRKLPFGCHGWEKALDFWKPIFKKYGYEI